MFRMLGFDSPGWCRWPASSASEENPLSGPDSKSPPENPGQWRMFVLMLAKLFSFPQPPYLEESIILCLVVCGVLGPNQNFNQIP